MLGAYWGFAAQGELRLPCCSRCAARTWPPRAHCPQCGAAEFRWERAAGTGTVHTFTVVRQTSDPYWAARVPYVVAIVALPEGPRLMANVVGCDADAVRIGMAVTVAFIPAAEGLAVPVFMPRAP